MSRLYRVNLNWISLFLFQHVNEIANVLINLHSHCVRALTRRTGLTENKKDIWKTKLNQRKRFCLANDPKTALLCPFRADNVTCRKIRTSSGLGPFH